MNVSPAGAVLHSVGTTAGAVAVGYLLDQRLSDEGAGAVVILSGLLLGPSVGNVVQGNYRGALIGGGLRLGGAGLALGAVASTFMNESASDTFITVAGGALVVGGVALLAGTVYDVVTAGRYAGRTRLARAADIQSGTPLGVLPIDL